MRQFHLQDLTALYNYRHQVITLDCGYTYTRGGNLLGTSLLFEQLSPERNAFLGIEIEPFSRSKLLGQLSMDADSHTAQVNFLAPDTHATANAMKLLIEGLCKQAGEKGAVCVRADVEVGDAVFSSLKDQHFRTYDRLRIWNLPPQVTFHRQLESGWSATIENDLIGIRHLYASLIPPLVQAAQPLLPAAMPDMVFWQEGEILGYMESAVGPAGIFLKPTLHPAIQDDAGRILYQSLQHYFPLMGRPVFVAVPSYQGWLEAILYKLQAEVVSLRSLMVRYLAQPLRLPEMETAMRSLEKVRMRPSHFQGQGGDDC
jgi:hypothetical protein